MSLMNLQKLRRVCYRDTYGRPAMTINLPPDDPLNHVEMKYTDGTLHYAQILTIHCDAMKRSSPLWIKYHTKDPAIRSRDDRAIYLFNISLTRAFKPRLDKILIEQGFHSDHLPEQIDIYHDDNVAFEATYELTLRSWEQIFHACYDDGASLRSALRYQVRLNRT